MDAAIFAALYVNSPFSLGCRLYMRSGEHATASLLQPRGGRTWYKNDEFNASRYDSADSRARYRDDASWSTLFSTLCGLSHMSVQSLVRTS